MVTKRGTPARVTAPAKTSLPIESINSNAVAVDLRTEGEDSMQGEGNPAAAKAFNDAERRFVASGRVEAAARAAAPTSEIEQQEMFEAEAAGARKAHARRTLPTAAPRDSSGSKSSHPKGNGKHK